MTVSVDRDKFEQLMMGAIDNELDTEQRQEFEQALAQNKAWQLEYEKYKNLKEVTGTMQFSSPSPEVWDQYWLTIYNRIERGIGWLIFSTGVVILLTYLGFHMVEAIINEPNLAIILKVGILLTIGGLALLFVSVVRERLFTRKYDPYKEIKR